jgi:hypothetical protein
LVFLPPKTKRGAIPPLPTPRRTSHFENYSRIWVSAVDFPRYETHFLRSVQSDFLKIA